MIVLCLLVTSGGSLYAETRRVIIKREEPTYYFRQGKYGLEKVTPNYVDRYRVVGRPGKEATVIKERVPNGPKGKK